ncbi:glycoside hydrolase family 3 C-terminal domain-containing protein [Flavobacterium subsaxonicum]|uniref:Glycoside hydrolase n=1 Tax=Flavobacterium subsaxonicum WB 4.1-42 = DSM 21790 TaxID=1121898 RepID=A0A0A2MI08_9FLAO|nr:glycoside hydrolase family 3 C-terminal domain-containing protein [Flavobacterium subsaxonicum]KGO92272.1 glycoside hydrolase [Flavobacterium subsaxonicum WB 4.1-42 = DSM 21790]
MKYIKMNKRVKVTLLTALVLANLSFKGAPGDEKNPPLLTVDGLQFADLNRNGKLDVYEDYRRTIEDRVNDLVAQMTEDEKASFVLGTGMPGYDGITPVVGAIEGRVPGAAGGTYEIERLGIPAIIVADGPAGLRIKPKRDNDTNTYYCTAFPVGTALASTWNTELIESVGKAMGNEVKEYGIDVLLAPALNIHRNPLCGRNFEYYSEDPLVSGKIAAAMVNGIQSNGVGTSIKHFAANNQETNRLSINEHISERAMRELYLKNFEITVKESQPWTVMSSYNLINGTYTSAREDLLTEILRNEWGFKGIVMTDWFGGYAGFESLKGTSNVTAQLTAGNDLLMPGMDQQKKSILADLKSGKLSKDVLDRNIKRILELVMKSPVTKKYKYTDKPDLKGNAKVTRDAAAEGMVLLKNESNVLPYTNKTGTIAAFGVTSYSFIAGGTGSGDVNEAYTISLLDGLSNAGFKLDEELKKVYVPFAEKENKKELARREKEGLLVPPPRFSELDMTTDFIAQRAAADDLAIITLGRNSGEGGDRAISDFNIGTDEAKLIDDVSKAFHAKGKKVVVILNIGGVMETASWKNKVDAILLAWQPGQEGGNSVADVLSGKVNPSGKLTMTFPVKYEDTPSAKNWLGTPADNPKEVTYEEGVYVGYRYYNTFNVKPSYEFGYGKSYTTFDYTDVRLGSKAFDKTMTVTVTVKNNGKVAGKEVVEVYLSAPAKNIDKPKSELKAFGKTKELKPGESQTLTLTLSAKDLASFVESKSAWVAEAGTYTVSVGASSFDIKKTATFTLAKEQEVEKVKKAFAADKKFADMKP